MRRYVQDVELNKFWITDLPVLTKTLEVLVDLVSITPVVHIREKLRDTKGIKNFDKIHRNLELDLESPIYLLNLKFVKLNRNDICVKLTKLLFKNCLLGEKRLYEFCLRISADSRILSTSLFGYVLSISILSTSNIISRLGTFVNHSYNIT